MMYYRYDLLAFVCVIAAVFFSDWRVLIAVLTVIFAVAVLVRIRPVFVSELICFYSCIGYLLLREYTPVDITILVFYK